MSIRETLTKKRSRPILDVIPGAAAALVLNRLTFGLHTTPLEAAAVAGVSVLVGFYAGFAVCSYLRAKVAQKRKGRASAIFLSVAISLCLSVAILLAGGLAPLGNLGLAPSYAADTYTSSARNNPSKAYTVVQSANGLTQKDITANEVERWASFLVKRGKLKAVQTCMKNGGDKDACRKIDSNESHRIIEIDGNRLAIIHFRMNLGKQLNFNGFRVMGIKNGQLISVACLRMNDSPIRLTGGTCAHEIQKSLGVSLPK